MTLSDFKSTLSADTPPDLPSPLLRALWYDARGDWKRAHEIAQDVPGADGAWVHAYLHREEGDEWNANYWYRRAGRKMPEQTLEEEWEAIVQELLDRSG